MTISGATSKDNLFARLEPYHKRLVEYLSEQQAAAALSFIDNPESVEMPPMALDVMTSILIDKWMVEEYEDEVSVPRRSAKALLAQALDTYIALDRSIVSSVKVRRKKTLRYEVHTSNEPRDEVVEDLLARIEWLTCTNEGADDETASIMARLGVSKQLAHLYLILKRAKGVTLPRERIMNRLYANKPDDADTKIIGVLVHKLRKKLPSDMRIDSVWGVGYRLVSVADQKQT